MTNRKDPLLCKLPPQNVEAEEALISAVLIDNNTLSEIVEILSPDDFYKYAHKKIFGSIIDLYKNNVPVGFFSLEMSKEQLVMRLICAESRLNAYNLQHGFVTPEDWCRLNAAGEKLAKASIYIDDASDNTALKLRAKARRLKMEQGLGLIIIDYLQLMKVHRPSERRDLDISEISRSLKGLAKDLNIPVITLSQLNRQLEIRDDKRPRLADLRESGALEQDADVVIFIHREEVFKEKKRKTKETAPVKEGVADIIVAKQRNGPTGTVQLAFLKAYTRFENLVRF